MADIESVYVSRYTGLTLSVFYVFRCAGLTLSLFYVFRCTGLTLSVFYVFRCAGLTLSLFYVFRCAGLTLRRGRVRVACERLDLWWDRQTGTRYWTVLMQTRPSTE